MQFLTVTSLLGFVAGLAIAAPLSPQAVGKVALPREAQSFDLTYIDKRDAEAEAAPQGFDLTYIDKRDAEAEAVPQGFDLTYIDRRVAEAEAAPQGFDLTYIDKA